MGSLLIDLPTRPRRRDRSAGSVQWPAGLGPGEAGGELAAAMGWGSPFTPSVTVVDGPRQSVTFLCLDHLALTALVAAWERCSADRAAAVALPPRRPSTTA
jgi:hypothetical protein